jgi:hypothetical protein
MARITGKFYRNGTDNQKAADIIVDLKRPNKFRLTTWSPEQKIEALRWMGAQEKIFEAFKSQIVESINLES